VRKHPGLRHRQWDPYIASICENTNAEIVYELLHVAQKITDAVDTLRRQEFEKADAAMRKKFKKKRFLILKRRKKLDEEKQKTLKTLMAENERLY